MAATRLTLTFDVDWASDCAIDTVAEKLVEWGVRLTWSVTHSCSAVDRLPLRPDLFEPGIHTNFLTCSTHGVTQEEVLPQCIDLVREVLSMRSHSVYQSGPPLNLIAQRTPIRVSRQQYFSARNGRVRPLDQWLARA